MGRPPWRKETARRKLPDREREPWYCTPDQDCWPNGDRLRELNATLNGRLQEPPFQNRSFNDSGYYQNTENYAFLPSLLVRAGSVDDVKNAIKFSDSHRIRVVVKNLGNSFRGESSGSGALVISTRGLWEISVDDSYESCGSTFPALKVGGGVIWGEVYEWMHKNKLNYSSVGGACRSVSASGGWLQGLGLSSQIGRMYGFGVDTVLEYEIVLPSGEHVLANKCSHPSVFKVLRGGGGGSWGVICSVRYKLFPQSKYQELRYLVPAAESMPMWKALAKHAVGMDHRLQVTKLETRALRVFIEDEQWGGFEAPELYKDPSSFFSAMAVSFMGELRDLEATELHTDLSSVGINPVRTQSFDTFTEMKLNKSFWPPRLNWKTCNAGMRLIPRSLFDDQEQVATLMYNVSFQTFGCGGFYQVGGACFDNYQNDPDATYVNPKTREAVFIVNINDHDYNRWWLAQGWTGTSINHEHWDEPNWQDNTWGLNNYNKLLKEKERIDPNKLFHCRRCVGWTGY